jgi:hypothetical protein
VNIKRVDQFLLCSTLEAACDREMDMVAELAGLTLVFEALLQLDDLLVVLVLQLLHEVAVLLHQSR